MKAYSHCEGRLFLHLSKSSPKSSPNLPKHNKNPLNKGFFSNLNGVLDDINYHLRKTIACMLERCQTTVFIECFYILCIN